MKYFYIITFLLVIGCENSKKKSSDNNKNQPKTKVETKSNDKTVSSTNDLMVVLKNPKELTDTKALIVNSGLVWEKMLLNENSLKVALVRVPSDKKDFWITRLMESGQFKIVENYTEKSFENLIREENSALISMRKTPCFGDCPTYEIIIDKEGNVKFNGLEYTAFKGENNFKLSDKDFEKLKEKLGSADFDSFKSKYDNPKISDLPSTFIVHSGKEVQIRLWKDIPDSLIDIHEFIEGILLDKKLVN